MASKKLLVADDSLTIQKVIRLALANEGYDIQAVSDGNDAVQQISLFRPDLVLIDVSLPGKTAFEVKREVNTLEDLRGTRFVLMSSAFEKVDEAQAAEVHFHGRLTKPFDPAHLRQTLSDVLAREPEPALGNYGASPQSLGIAPPLPEFRMPGSLEIPAEMRMDEPIDPISVDTGNEDLADDWTKPIQPIEPPISAPEHPTPAADDDIRELTESTIRMSGLDDFQWTVKEPSLKPPSALLSEAGSESSIQPPATFPQHEEPQEHAAMQPPPIPPSFASEPDKTLQIERMPDQQEISDKKLEQMIEKRLEEKVEQAIEKIAQKLLPDVAERVIKQEIHRLLSEQP